jgi:hypothetical protein
MTDYSAEEMERERRRRLIDDARATVERLKDVEKRREEIQSLPPSELSRRLIPACADDAVQRWARDADERERERRAAERELRREQRRDRLIRRRYEGAQPAAATRAGDDWNAWCDTRIAEALDRERDALAEGFGEGIAKLLADAREATSRAIRDEIRDLKIEIAKLGSEAAELRAALAGDRSRVVDLPRRNVN